MREIFLKIVSMSISASLLVLAVLLLRLILKKAPKWICVLLWGLVAVRLIVPVSFQSSFSLVPKELADGQLLSSIADSYLGQPETILVYDNNAADPQKNPIASFEVEAGSLMPPKTVENTVFPVLGAIYYAGVALMIAYTFVSFLLLRRKVATAVLLQDNIYQSEYVDSPFVLGILRPKIYLPYRMGEQSQSYVIAHEQAHIRRRDHWWKPLGFLLLAVHWFNPLLWLGYILLCRDIELACDEKVIKQMDSETKADYTNALIACSINRRRIAACPLAFGEVGVKARVKSVMHYRKPAFWIIVASVVLCIAVALCFLTNPATSVSDPLSVFIDCQIAGRHQSQEINGRASCVNWEVLGTKTRGSTATVYMWILYEEYSMQGGELALETSTHTPAVISAKQEDGVYQLIEYWEALDCACREQDIREKFPWNLEGMALDPERFLERQREENESLAREFFLHSEDGAAVNKALVAKSGRNAVPLVSATSVTDCVKSVYWLTIDPDSEDLVPFTLLQDGIEKIGFYSAFDSQTLEPLDHFLPSGLSPQTYLFQNADPSRMYIVLVSFSKDFGAEKYAFGVRFAEPAIDPMLADVVETFEGSRMTYYKKADGTYLADGLTYQYRLVITGRMHNAAKISTFIYLSNLETITFDQAWKAAGFSSSTEDYFSADEAVLVDWLQDDPITATQVYPENGPSDTKAMTLEDVIALSKLGMGLTWEDLKEYTGTDTGSGLYIVQYDIDPEFFLLVGDGKTTDQPMYVSLNAKSTGASCDIRKNDVEDFITHNQNEALNYAIYKAILTHNADGTFPDLPNGPIPAESHFILGVESKSGTPLVDQSNHIEETTVYIQYVYHRYMNSGGQLESVAASATPAKLTFSIDPEDGYTLKEFWQPHGGSGYAEEIRENFPKEIADKVLDPSNDTVDMARLETLCLEKAKAYISKFEE